MNILIMGKPGSGKGTFCKKLVEDFNYKYIGTGDLLRAEKKSGSELGKKITSIIDSGNLVPDSIVDKIVLNEFRKFTKHGSYFLIDGYPRTNNQAINLNRMINVQAVVWINVSDETVIKRNLKRGLTSGRPDDSNEDIIKTRLENYKKESLPVKDYYRNKIIEIDGEGTIEDVYKRITDTLFETYKEPRDIKDIL